MKYALTTLLFLLATAAFAQIPAGRDPLTGLTFAQKGDTLFATTPDGFQYRVAFSPAEQGGLLDLRNYPFRALPPMPKPATKTSEEDFFVSPPTPPEACQLRYFYAIIANDSFFKYIDCFHGYTRANLFFCGTQIPPFQSLKHPGIRCITICREKEIDWRAFSEAAIRDSAPIYFTTNRSPLMDDRPDRALPVIVRNLNHIPPYIREKHLPRNDTQLALRIEFPHKIARMSSRQFAAMLEGYHGPVVLQSGREMPTVAEMLTLYLPDPPVFPPPGSLPGLALIDLRYATELNWDTLCHRLAAVHQPVVITTCPGSNPPNRDTLRVIVGEVPDSLPPCLGRIQHLTELTLPGSGIVWLPQEIGNLSQLKVLNLACNRLRELPAAIRQLTLLKTLNVSHNHLQELPAELATLPALTWVDASYNGLTHLPPAFARQSSSVKVYIHTHEHALLKYALDSLYISHHIAVIPGGSAWDSLPDLQTTRILSLRKHPAIRWEPLLGQLQASKQKIVVTSGQGSVFAYHHAPEVLTVWIPDTLDSLLTATNRPIDVAFRHTDELPENTTRLRVTLPCTQSVLPALCGIPHVGLIDLRGCTLLNPAQLSDFLQQLNRPFILSFQDQQHSPDSLLILCSPRMQDLLSLFSAAFPISPSMRSRIQSTGRAYLPAAELTNVPPFVLMCTHLTDLDVSHNRISALPPGIGHLRKLRWLDLSDNPVNTFPPEIQHLTHLETLVVSVGQFPPEELAKLRQWLPGCKVMFLW